MPPSDPLRTFATCAGRLSAQMEFEWMFDGAASGVTQDRRGEVLDILDAMTPPTQARDVLNWRIEAKMAHSSLLQRTTFSDDSRIQMQARRLSVQKLKSCTALLLG